MTPKKKNEKLNINVKIRVLIDPNEIAYTINDYFTSVMNKLDSRIPRVT